MSLDSVLILIAENFTKVLIVTRTPTQAAELPDQFGSQMKVNAHMGSKCCRKSFNWSVSRLDSQAFLLRPVVFCHPTSGFTSISRIQNSESWQ